jgi:hypothetical protein
MRIQGSLHIEWCSAPIMSVNSWKYGTKEQTHAGHRLCR